MPSIVGQERSQHSGWREVESLILENVSLPVSTEWEKVREEVNKILKEKQNVCEIDKRNND